MNVVHSVALFVIAGLCEIGGGYLSGNGGRIRRIGASASSVR